MRQTIFECLMVDDSPELDVFIEGNGRSGHAAIGVGAMLTNTLLKNENGDYVGETTMCLWNGTYVTAYGCGNKIHIKLAPEDIPGRSIVWENPHP